MVVSRYHARMSTLAFLLFWHLYRHTHTRAGNRRQAVYELHLGGYLKEFGNARI